MKLNPEHQVIVTEPLVEHTADQFGLDISAWELVHEGIANRVVSLRHSEGLAYIKYYNSLHRPERVDREVDFTNLALEAGIDPSLLTRILSGERTITPEVAKQIADALVRWGRQCEQSATAIRKHIR